MRLVILLLLLWVSISHSQPAVLVEHRSGQPGEIVSVALEYDGTGSGVVGIQGDIAFDAAALTADITNCGNATISCSVVGTEVRFAGFSDLTEIPSGSLGTIEFTINASVSPTQRFPLTVNDEEYSDANVELVTSSGSTDGSVTAVAGTGPGILVGSRSARPGETVVISIDYDGTDSGAIAFDGKIPFDNVNLTADASSCGATLGDADISCSVVDNEIRLQGVSGSFQEIPSGSLGSVSFTIGGGVTAPKSFPLEVSDENYSDSSGQPFGPQSTTDGLIMAFDSDGPSLFVEDVLSFPGGVVRVDVNYIGAGTGVAGIQADIEFDSTVLTANVIDCGGNLGGLSACSVLQDPAKVRLAIADATELPDGLIGTIEFTVDQAAVAPQSLPLAVNDVQFTDEAALSDVPPNTLSDGSITLQDGSDIAVARDGNLISDGGSDNLGTQAVGTVTVSYSVENLGSKDLTIDTPTASNLSNVENFTVTAPPASPVLPGGSTTFDIQFDVITAAAFGLDLSLTNNDPDENPFDFGITGAGVGPEIDIQRPAGTDNSISSGGTDSIGDRTIGTVSLTYTVANLGNADLSINATPTASNLVNAANFVVQQGPQSPLPAGNSTTFEVSFDVLTNGGFGLDLLLGNSDADENPYLITISGTGIGGNPEIDIQRPAGSSIVDGGTDDLGFVPLGANNLTYTVTSSGNVPLFLSTPSLVNAVNVDNLAVSVAPDSLVGVGEQTTFQVTFDTLETTGGCSDSTVDFCFDIVVENNDATENPYNIAVQGKVPAVQFTAELQEPDLLVDNDGDGKPNPSDTVRFAVLLKNDGDRAVGDTSFTLVAPEGTSVSDAGFDGNLSSSSFTFDSTSISAAFTDLKGGGATFSQIITFDLLINNDTTVSEVSLQGMFTYAADLTLTDDPSVAGEENPTTVTIGSLSRVLPPETSQNFGQATALSDQFVAVGSPGDDGGAGAVSIYRVLPDGQRDFVDRIVPPADFAGSAFGVDVALDGDVLVVGSSDSGVAPKGAQGNKTAVYQLFGNGIPQLLGQIRANLDTGFGSAVDIDGETIVIGAPDEDASGVIDAGAVYMYSLNNLIVGDDTPERRVGSDNPQSMARFGAAVACADGKVVIGSPGPIGDALSGRAAIFDALTGNLKDIPAPFDGSGEFGAAVAIEGGSIFIGAPEAPNGGGVFEYDGEGSSIGGKIIPDDAADGDEFGRAVTLENGEVFVGAPNSLVEGFATDGNFGAVYRFGQSRQLMQKIGAFSESSGTFDQQEGFGTDVAVNGTIMLIGAPKSQNQRGAAAYQRGEPRPTLFADGFECTNLLGCTP